MEVGRVWVGVIGGAGGFSEGLEGSWGGRVGGTGLYVLYVGCYGVNDCWGRSF